MRYLTGLKRALTGGVAVVIIVFATALPANAAIGVDSYGLPFMAGTSATVTQSPGGSYSHADGYNKTAVDFGVPSGTPVVASQSGVIYFEGWSGLGGITALVNHGNDQCTQYAHLSSTVVSKGQVVMKGQLIGYSGGSSNGRQNVFPAHLHWAGVFCSSQKSSFVVATAEAGTNYPQGAVVKSANTGSSLRGQGSQRCLDVAGGSSASGARIQLWDCNKSPAQVWLYDGTLRVLTNRCLDITGGAIRSGTFVQSYACNGTAAQRWNLYSDGTVRPASNTTLCLDAQGNGKVNGTRIQIYSCNGTPAQRWF